MSGPLAVRLTGDGVDASVAGGKGAALDRLVALAAPVPAAGVVTTMTESERCGVLPTPPDP